MATGQNVHTYLRLFLLRLRPIPGERFKRLGGAFALVFDALADGARQGVRMWLHAEDTMPDALKWCLKSAGLPTYHSDWSSPATYVATMARLAAKWTSHARAGTPGGLEAELVSAGFTGAVVVVPVVAESSFAVTLPGVTADVTWGAFTWGATAWEVSGITPAEADRLVGIVQFWQAARSRFLGIHEV